MRKSLFTRISAGILTAAMLLTSVNWGPIVVSAEETADSEGGDSAVQEESGEVSTASVAGSILYNDYIGVNSDGRNFSIGTYMGDPDSTTDDDQKLLYGWNGSGTSFVLYYVDGDINDDFDNIYGQDYIVGYGYPPTDDIMVKREFRIVRGSSTGNEDVIEISTVMTNNGDTSHEVGLRYAMDTMVGDNDYAPFYIPGIGSTTTQTFLSGDEIPQYWQAFDDITNPTVIAQGTLYRSIDERPDEVIFGNYGELSSYDWDVYYSEGSENNDSAVSLRWNPVTLEPGESRVYKTWYGIGAMEQDFTADLGLSVTADQEAAVNSAGDGYNDITITAYVNNQSNTSRNAEVSLASIVPEGSITLKEPSEWTYQLDNIAPGDTQMVSWIVNCSISEVDTVYNYEVQLSAEDMEPVSLEQKITIPALDLNPPIFRDGSVAANVYGNAVELSWPEADDTNGIARYVVWRDGEEIGESQSASYIDKDLETNREYAYEITAEDPSGNVSAPLEAAFTTALPSIAGPENTGYGGKEDIDLEFLIKYPSSNSEGQAEVEARPEGSDEEWTALESEIQTLSETESAVKAVWDVSELASGEYEIRVTAGDKYGAEHSEIFIFDLDTDAPQKLDGVSAAGEINSITVSWLMAVERDTAGYHVYRRSEEGTEWLRIASVDGRAELSYTDKDITNGIEYEYYVTAVDEYGLESQPSDIVTAQGRDDDELPVVQTMQPARNTVLAGEVQISASASDNIGVEKILYSFSVGASNNWYQFGESSGSTGSVVLNTRSFPDGTIRIQPIAVDGSGNMSDGALVYTYYVDNTAPSKVAGLRGTGVSTVVTLNWEDVPEDDLQYFLVEQLVNGVYQEAATVSDARGVNIRGLLPDTEYTFRVCAVDNVGNRGEYSDPVSVSTKSDTTGPVITRITPGAGYYTQNIPVSVTADDDFRVASLNVQISTDLKTWTTVSEQAFSGENKTETYDCTIDISGLEDGTVYVRAVAVDQAGNQGDDSASAPYVQYVIDRQAPDTVQNVEAVQDGSVIRISWDQGDDSDTAGFRVYRSSSENGEYEPIASEWQNISFYDRSIEFNTEYFYTVTAYDHAGNESARSAVVSAAAALSEDVTEPEIGSISPADQSVMGPYNADISVLASDDYMMDKIVIRYGVKGLFGLMQDPETVEIQNSESGYYFIGTTDIPIENYETGDVLAVEAEAYDAAGNVSKTVKAEYRIDRDAPEIADVSVTYEADKAVIEWSGGEEEDLSGYYIYRSLDGGNFTKIGQRAANGRDYSFTDSAISTGHTYQYRINAFDKTGNTKSVESTELVIPEEMLLEAAFQSDTFIQAGAECLFDGTVSRSDLRIVSWLFDFGDGTTSTESKPVHIYQENGTYNVSLTVTDAEGNTDVYEQTVSVQERRTMGILKVQVLDDSGNVLQGVPVYFDMEGENTVKATDGKGYVEFTALSGMYKVGAYRDGSLPAAKDVSLAGGSYREIQLVLVQQPIVTGNFEVHRMTLDEIVAAGIDISDPANQQIMKFNLHLTYGEQLKDFTFGANLNGDIVWGDNTFIIENDDDDDEDDRKATINVVPVPNPTGGGGLSEENVIIAIMDIPVSASFLKEFFDVKLHIINNAAEEFTLTDNLVHLNVPEGMTIMAEGENPTADAAFGDLKGQEEKTLSWILRGDTEGDYELTADYSSTLDMFDASVNAVFKSDNIHVYGTSAVNINVNINRSIRYQTMYFDIGMENVGDIDLYMPSMTVMEAAIQDFLLDQEEMMQTREVTLLGIRLENSDGYVQYIGEDPRKLSAGETLYHEYAIYNAVSDTDVSWLREAIAANLENIDIDQINITVTDMDLYEIGDEEDAAQKIEAMYKENYSAYQTIYYDSNYAYFTYAEERYNNFGHNLGQNVYSLADVVFSLDFSLFTNEDKKEFMQNLVGEMVSDETVTAQMLERLDGFYLDASNDILSGLSQLAQTTLSPSQYNEYGIGEIMNVLKRRENVEKLSNTIKQDGVTDSFGDRLIDLAGSAVTAGFIEWLNYVGGNELDNPIMFAKNTLSECISETLGTPLQVLGAVSEVIQTWNDSIDTANVLMQMKAAEEESKFLLESIAVKAAENSKTGWMEDEARELIEKLEEECETSRQAFISALNENIRDYVLGTVGKQAVKLAVSKSVKYVFGAAAPGIGVIYAVLQTAFGIIDGVAGWGTYYDNFDKLSTVMLISVFMRERYDQFYYNADYYNALRSLKYLIKTRLIGERAYAEFIGSNPDQSDDLPARTGYDEPDKFLSAKNELIIRCRDQIFQTTGRVLDIPDAPEVSFNYRTEKTNESFSDVYEYSIDGGENWITCDGGPISVNEKETAQILYVRVRGSEDSLSGNIAYVSIAGKQRFTESVEVKYTGGIYEITGLTPGTVYDICTAANAQTENDDWQIEAVTADSSGRASFQGERANYLHIRRSASTDAFASTAAAVRCTFGTLYTISAEPGEVGAGTVTGGGAYSEGTKVSLFAEANTGYRFCGWYENGELITTASYYMFDAAGDRTITAEFEPVRTESVLQVTFDGCVVEYTSGSTIETWESGHEEKTLFQNTAVTLKAEPQNGYEFLYWKNAGEDKILSEEPEYQFTVRSDMQLEAVCRPVQEDQVTIVFKTSAAFSDKEIASVTVEKGEEIQIPAPIAFEGYNFIGWDADGDGKADVDASESKVTADENLTFTAVYEVNVEYSIAVAGGKIIRINGIRTFDPERSYAKDTMIEIIADEPEAGMFFIGWSADGGKTIFSQKEDYTFFLQQDMELTAVYGEEETEARPIVNFAIQTRTRSPQTGKDTVRMGISWSTDNDYTILEEGILRTYEETSSDNLYVGTSDSDVKHHICTNVSQSGSYTYNLTIGNTSANLNKSVYAVGYITYRDKQGDVHTVYTEVVEMAPVTN